ncbi:MAG: hypothetical protein IJF92_05390 [Bacilli bacterium]|nr:hypothetical protein [Bacilli bacterium]
MNDVNVDDEILKNDPSYQEFLNNNPGFGYLKIRASSINEAIPVSGINIKVSKVIGSNNVVFFEGATDESGMINDIVLPAPKAITSDEEVPNFTEYKLEAKGDNVDEEYTISICCSITIIQYINVKPNIGDVS